MSSGPCFAFIRKQLLKTCGSELGLFLIFCCLKTYNLKVGNKGKKLNTVQHINVTNWLAERAAPWNVGAVTSDFPSSSQVQVMHLNCMLSLHHPSALPLPHAVMPIFISLILASPLDTFSKFYSPPPLLKWPSTTPSLPCPPTEFSPSLYLVPSLT
jgi:hypothetical protein